MDITVMFVRNYLVEVLEEFPGIGPMFKAARKTLDDLETEKAQVDESMRSELASHVSSELPTLEYQSNLLPAPDSISVKH